jgi:hypothetical protein
VVDGSSECALWRSGPVPGCAAFEDLEFGLQRAVGGIREAGAGGLWLSGVDACEVAAGGVSVEGECGEGDEFGGVGEGHEASDASQIAEFLVEFSDGAVAAFEVLAESFEGGDVFTVALLEVGEVAH